MDPRFAVSREEFHHVRLDLKRVQVTQHQFGDRLRMLERRLADDAVLKSVWSSPFPSVLAGTPQHGPLHMPTNDTLGDFEAQSQSMLGSLHLDADDEPSRRGAASRANSVRFDESALQSSSWALQTGRQAADSGLVRPNSGMGGHQMMERSFSHKSDGRHSSAGHSMHSVHSLVSGRVSSLGLETNSLLGGDDENSPVDSPEPVPPGFYFLGSPPAIIRCWLTSEWTARNLLYAVVSTGSQKSTIDASLVKDLDLCEEMRREADGVYRLVLPIYLAEASVKQPTVRSPSPTTPSMPSITSAFEVTGMDQPDHVDGPKSIRVFIGSHTLRMHSADLLLSQNAMTLYGNERDKLRVPFVRPEDDSVFTHLTTANMVRDRSNKLNATAPEFVSNEKPAKDAVQDCMSEAKSVATSSPGRISPSPAGGVSPSTQVFEAPTAAPTTSSALESNGEADQQTPVSEQLMSPLSVANETSTPASISVDAPRREPSAAIRNQWRQTASGVGTEGSQRENTPLSGSLSGYQPAARPRGMKVLRPTKSSTSSARTGSSYEPAAAPRSANGEPRRKGQGVPGAVTNELPSSINGGGNATGRWGETRRNFSVGSQGGMGGNLGGGNGGGDSIRPQSATTHQESIGRVQPTSAPRSANNPLGSASAFAWMGHTSKPKTPTAAVE